MADVTLHIKRVTIYIICYVYIFMFGALQS